MIFVLKIVYYILQSPYLDIPFPIVNSTCTTLSMKGIKQCHGLFYKNKDKVAHANLQVLFCTKAKKFTLGNKRKQSKGCHFIAPCYKKQRTCSGL